MVAIFNVLNIFSKREDASATQSDVNMNLQPSQEHELEESEGLDNIEPPVENKESFVDNLLTVAPFIKNLLGESTGFYIADKEKFVYCDHGEVRLDIKPGDIVKEGSVTGMALKKKDRILSKIGKEVYGIPYIGASYPIFEDGNVVGAMATVVPITLQENLNASAITLQDDINAIALAIETLAASSQELAAAANDLNNTAQEINEEIKQTDEISVLITDVAERTHLLGLNAAIESARAGEHGKGFSIVAGEIRKMSENTKSQVKGIKTNLKAMKESMASVTMAFENIAASSEQQAASTQEISIVLDSLKELSTALKQQAENLVK